MLTFAVTMIFHTKLALVCNVVEQNKNRTCECDKYDKDKFVQACIKEIYIVGVI